MSETQKQIKSLIDQMQVAQQEYENKKLAIKDTIKAPFNKLIEEFFAKHSDIATHIYWNQYTPYFNDGSECEFSVNEVQLAVKKDVYFEIDELSRKDFYIKCYSNQTPQDRYNELGKFFDKNGVLIEGYWYEENTLNHTYLKYFLKLNTNYQGMIRDFLSINDVISENEDLMLDMFGDHAEIICKADGIEINEYNHD